jgi:hypothetical protein
MQGFSYTQKSCAGVRFAGQLSIRKEHYMQNTQEQNRVLGRLNARIVAPEELKVVAGGFTIGTGQCTLQINNQRDGDCHFGG